MRGEEVSFSGSPPASALTFPPLTDGVWGGGGISQWLLWDFIARV